MLCSVSAVAHFMGRGNRTHALAVPCFYGKVSFGERVKATAIFAAYYWAVLMPLFLARRHKNGRRRGCHFWYIFSYFGQCYLCRVIGYDGGTDPEKQGIFGQIWYNIYALDLAQTIGIWAFGNKYAACSRCDNRIFLGANRAAFSADCICWAAANIAACLSFLVILLAGKPLAS